MPLFSMDPSHTPWAETPRGRVCNAVFIVVQFVVLFFVLTCAVLSFRATWPTLLWLLAGFGLVFRTLKELTDLMSHPVALGLVSGSVALVILFVALVGHLPMAVALVPFVKP